MKTVHCLLFPALALTLLLGSASAQSITSVTGDGPDPSMGSLGTTLTIAGTGLGGPTGLAKPAAFLQDPVTLKKFALKVTNSSDGSVTAVITKAAYGSLDVAVQPKGGALLVATGAFTVPLPTITGILPANETGTIGTLVTISGTGLFGVLGQAKPKVMLMDAVTGKKFALKVSTFTDTQVTALITKAVAGTLQLQLQPKGGAVLVASASFTVPLPNISSTSPGYAYVNDVVTLTGTYFGDKKPKVKVGGKSAKVMSFGDTQVTFTMSKKLAKGVFSVDLINKVGTATKVAAIINQGSTPDTSTSDLFMANVGKTKFVAQGLFSIFTFFSSGPPPLVTVNGLDIDPVAFTTKAGLDIAIPFDPNTFTTPVAFVDAANGEIDYLIPNPTPFAPPIASWSSNAPGGSYSIAVLSVGPGENGLTLMRGAYSATLVLTSPPGTGVPTLSVTSGEFRTSFDASP